MRLMPNPATAPRTLATTGLGMRRSARITVWTSWMRASNWTRFSALERPSTSVLNHLRSPPAMKCSPPRSTRQRTAGSCSAASTPSTSASVRSRSSAFSARGRFSVSVATPASCAARTAGSGMCAESLRQAGERRMPVHRLIRNALDQDFSRFEQALEVDAGGDAHRLEHEHEVLGDHVAARPRRERAAAEAGHRAVEMAHAFLERRERVGEPQAARVVEVGALQLFSNGFPNFGEKALHLRRIGVADGIGERDAVAELGERGGDAHHVVLGHRPLYGAAERGRYRALDLDAGVCELGAPAHFLDHLLGGHAHVGEAVLAARGTRERPLVRARLDRALEAFKVRRQRHHLQALYLHRLLNDYAGVRHGRNQLWRNEGADLDLAQAGAGEGADPGLLGLGRHEVLGILQAIARPDFADVDLGHAAILALRRSVRGLRRPWR